MTRRAPVRTRPEPVAGRFVIELTPGIVQRLQAVVSRHNAGQGSELTLSEWLHSHVQEIAVIEELQRVATDLAAQAQRDVDAAVAAERRRLMASE